MKRTLWILVAAHVGCSTMNDAPSDGGGTLDLHLRSRTAAGPVTAGERWEARKTAFVVCDMWDDHWCQGAARRVGELAPAVNAVLREARRRGAFVLHAPSTTVEFYKDTPARRRAREARASSTPSPLTKDMRWGTGWCWPDPSRESDLPIDDTDMGCDCPKPCALREPWRRQIAAIEVDQERDAITDDGQEAWNLFAARGIKNVVLLGVHLNMCVLGRPVGIRQMVRLGLNVALMRDLTDTMYNSRKRPFVNHFAGTDLVVEHVERYWCPSFTSADLLGGSPFRFREDVR